MKIFCNVLFIFLVVSSLAFGKEEVVDNNVIVKSFKWIAPSDIRSLFNNYFSEFNNKPFDKLAFKLKVDQINKELQTMGYYDSGLTSSIEKNNAGLANITLNFKIGGRTNFYFKGSTVFSFQELKNTVVEKVKNDLGKIDVDQIKVILNDMYEEVGVYNTKFEIVIQDGFDRSHTPLKNYILTIIEGEKIPVASISFRGNGSVTSNDLLKLYNINGTSLSKSGYYDKAYTEKMTNLIKKRYLEMGYVYAEVSRPRITSSEEEPIEMEYVINEKSQFNILNLKLENLNLLEASDLKQTLINQEGKPINIPELESDFKKVINYLQSKGYYFANITNLNSDDLIKYDIVNTTVDININLNLEKKICFQEVIINGNYKTKSEVIQREVNFTKNELIIPEKIETLRQKLSGLGLFSNLRITPYMIYENNGESDCRRANLIIQVKEKDFGTVEFTPGFRTDLGAKAAIGVTYNNIGGMNRAISFKAQGNQRFNLDSLDERRRIEDIKRFEYLAKLSFSEPYLLYGTIGSQVEFEASASAQKKRFSSFDAEIYRLSPQLSKNFTKNISSSVKYQLEKINQYDATETKDNDNFTIGSFTPSLTFDYRDDPINPHKGTYFNISSEWANHYFLSMKTADFEVNYLKLTSRNRVYFSVGNFIFATSLTGGYERNYAENFYIPSIKVFRLDGFDEIRGFEDGEINRLSNGIEVSKLAVTKEAYFLAFKFEPRYNLTDNMQIDVFFDAGRVFIDQFKPLDLRTSVGAGFKILTPVGSLDFDYGVKLKRESYPDGKRDAFGRFHLSIGFF